MDDSNFRVNCDDIDGYRGIFPTSPNDHHSRGNAVEKMLLLGAEKMLMGRNSPAPMALSGQENVCGAGGKGTKAMEFNENEYTSSQRFTFQSSQEIDYQSNYYNHEVPVDFSAFLRNLTFLVLKIAGFQIGLFARFLTLPIQIFNIWVAFLVFPFQAMEFARDHMKKKLLTLWSHSCFALFYFVCDRFRLRRQSVLRFAVRFCWAFFWSIYVILILVGMLAMGFVVGGIIMKNLVVEPIETTQSLNFDYTKTSPVSFVPISSTPMAAGIFPVSKNAGTVRPIPHNHQLQLAVSLTMPDSDHNRNLGIFQIKVESLSADGKVIARSSYPSMLRFKSPPIRFLQTIIKTIPLLTGIQSEIQNLRIEVDDYTEGFEPTAVFKVSIEQRAEQEPGHGVPEIYSAALHMESKLPTSKRMIWNWRRSMLVWMGMASFLTELMFALVFLRPVILPGRTVLKAIGAGKGSRYRMNKISR